MIQGSYSRAVFLAASLTGLASCQNSGSSGSDNASTNYAAAPPEGAFSITPGEYETVYRVTRASIQGLPPGSRLDLRQLRFASRSCIPIGYSIQGIDLRNIRFDIPRYGGCVFSGSQHDGQGDGSMSCRLTNLPANPIVPSSLSFSGSTTGSFGPNQIAFVFHSTLDSPGGALRGNVDIAMSIRRVGECTMPMFAPRNPAVSPNGAPPLTTAVPPPAATANTVDGM